MSILSLLTNYDNTRRNLFFRLNFQTILDNIIFCGIPKRIHFRLFEMQPKIIEFSDFLS